MAMRENMITIGVNSEWDATPIVTIPNFDFKFDNILVLIASTSYQ